MGTDQTLQSLYNLLGRLNVYDGLLFSWVPWIDWSIKLGETIWGWLTEPPLYHTWLVVYIHKGGWVQGEKFTYGWMNITPPRSRSCAVKYFSWQMVLDVNFDCIKAHCVCDKFNDCVVYTPTSPFPPSSPLPLLSLSILPPLNHTTKSLPWCAWRLAGVTVELLSRSLGYCSSGERQNHRLLVGWLCSCFQWVKSYHFWILTEGWPSLIPRLPRCGM